MTQTTPLRSIRALALLMMLSLLTLIAQAQPVETPEPDARTLCPVCGMVVSKYPAWIATVLYKDGHAHHFDGAKDMFKYLHALDKYAPGHRHEDIETIAVTEYYDLQRIDARTAWYVIGSDVLGPMGHEFIPLLSEADAQEFMADHGGAVLLRFDQVDAEWPIKLDQGLFE